MTRDETRHAPCPRHRGTFRPCGPRVCVCSTFCPRARNAYPGKHPPCLTLSNPTKPKNFNQDLENTTGAWDLYGQDSEKRYNSLQVRCRGHSHTRHTQHAQHTLLKHRVHEHVRLRGPAATGHGCSCGVDAARAGAGRGRE
jgi:hypothetical protein